jgi:hypothetical protein
MSNIHPTRSSSPAAQRMRRYRKQRRQGLRSVRILLDETDIDTLIPMGFLKEEQRHDIEAQWLTSESAGRVPLCR